MSDPTTVKEEPSSSESSEELDDFHPTCAQVHRYVGRFRWFDSARFGPFWEQKGPNRLCVQEKYRGCVRTQFTLRDKYRHRCATCARLSIIMMIGPGDVQIGIEIKESQRPSRVVIRDPAEPITLEDFVCRTRGVTIYVPSDYAKLKERALARALQSGK